MAGKMSFKNAKVPQLPNVGAASALIKLGAVIGIGLYAAGNSLYNVEGGHRAIVFNRLVGVKDKVCFIYFRLPSNGVIVLVRVCILYRH